MLEGVRTGGKLAVAFLAGWGLLALVQPVYFRLLALPVTLVSDLGQRRFDFRIDGERLFFSSKRAPRFEAELAMRPVTSNLPFLLAILAVIPGGPWAGRVSRVGVGAGLLALSHVLFLVTKVEVALVEAAYPLAGSPSLWRGLDDLFEISGKSLFPALIWLGIGFPAWQAAARARSPVPAEAPRTNQACPCGSGLKFKRCCRGRVAQRCRFG